VCEREIERDREGEREKEREGEKKNTDHYADRTIRQKLTEALDYRNEENEKGKAS
jgi:hypothetical protein